MHTIYVVTLPDGSNREQFCRIGVCGPTIPKAGKGESLYATISTYAAEKVYDLFLDDLKEEPYSHYVMSEQEDVYRMSAEEAVMLLMNHFRLSFDDYILKERITLDSGEVRERLTTRLTSLCSFP